MRQSPRRSLIAFPLLRRRERGAASRAAPRPPCAAAPAASVAFILKENDPPRGFRQVHGLSPDPTLVLLLLDLLDSSLFEKKNVLVASKKRFSFLEGKEANHSLQVSF